MGRNRVISQNKALFATPTGLLPSFYGYADATPSGVHATQLHRIDSLSFETDLAGARTDVREFGQLARIASLRTSDISPTVSVGYYLTNGENEHHLGFNISGLTNAGATDSQFISGILTEDDSKGKRNIYALVAAEGEDAFNQDTGTHNNNAEQDVIAFGACSLSNYSAEFAVGDIPRADVEFEASNIWFATGQNSGTISRPTHNPSLNANATAPADTGMWILPVPDTGNSSIDVLKPGDVSITFGDAANGLDIGGVDLSDICAQSISFDIPLSRTPIDCLGQEFAAFKSLDFPIDITMSVNALVKDFASGSLQQVLTNAVDGQKQDITINVKDRNDNTQTAYVAVIKNAILDSQNFSLGLDDNETVDLQFSAQIAGANNTDAGMFVSGAYIWDSAGVGNQPDTPTWSTIAAS